LHFSPFWEILAFLTTLINLCIFHLGRSPITTRPLWKIFVFFTTLKSSCFSSGQVAHYNKTTLKNLCIFHYFEKFLHFSPLWKIFMFFKTFHLGRSSITTRPLWKIFAFFTILRNLRISHHFWKIFVFFPTLKSSCFPPGQVAHYNKTTLKNLCIFHRFEKSSHFSPLWKIFVFFTT